MPSPGNSSDAGTEPARSTRIFLRPLGSPLPTWAVIGATTLLSAPGTRSPLLGLMLFYLSAAVLISALLAAAGKILATIVLGLASARFATTGAAHREPGVREQL